ncbi:MAG: glutathione S-transferase family protein [Myxococcota bacterium]
MLELYHNAASTCSQKVRLVLAEKSIDYASRDVDLLGGAQHDSEYVKLNPNHVVPTIVHDGTVVIESTLINEYLEDAFPEKAMRPADAAGRYAMRAAVLRIDQVHPATGILTYAIGPGPLISAQGQEAIDAHVSAIPNKQRAKERRSVLENGVKAPEFSAAMGDFVSLLDRAESDLAQHRWLAGNQYSLADAATLPYILRLDHLAMMPMIESRPRLSDWYARAQTRPSFEAAIGEMLPEGVINLFRANGEKVWGEVKATIDALPA